MNVGKINFGPLSKNALGFDLLFDELDRFVNSDISKTTNYPPYNLIKGDDEKYFVEIAASGFLQNELSINVKDGYLTVVGEKIQKEDSANYLYKGIATRNFSKSFKIADTINVVGAQFRDGILTIALVNIIPEHMRPRKIEIGSDFNTQQLLTEADKAV